MNYSVMCLAWTLLETVSPATGDTRNMKTPVLVAIIAVVLIVACLVLSGKSKDKK